MSRAREDRGSVSVLVAALVAVIVVLALGAADVARVFTAAARAQTAADAAALAAAQELAMPGGVATPSELAAGYAARNSATLTSCVCEPGTFTVDVEIRVSVGTLALAPDDLSVVAKARAVVDLPS